jgi:predicted ATPase with chaperone activity
MTLSVSPLSTPLIAGDVEFNQNLSPDAMMIYLQTRLDGIDAQVDTIFNDQKKQQSAQSIINKIKATLSELNPNADKPVALVTTARTDAAGTADLRPDIQRRVDEQLGDLAKIDPNLASQIRAQLAAPGQLFVPDKNGGNAEYIGQEVQAGQDVLNAVGKDLESTSQMNMIRLQSVMSARQTAIQLATNLVSSLGESTKAIVSNLGH